MNMRKTIPGSARLQRAGEGVSPSRTFLEGSESRHTNADPVKSSFRRKAETSTLQACGPRIPSPQPQWMFES